MCKAGVSGGPRKNRGSKKAVLPGVFSVSLSLRYSLKSQNSFEHHFCFSVVPCLLLGLLSQAPLLSPCQPNPNVTPLWACDLCTDIRTRTQFNALLLPLRDFKCFNREALYFHFALGPVNEVAGILAVGMAFPKLCIKKKNLSKSILLILPVQLSLCLSWYAEVPPGTTSSPLLLHHWLMVFRSPHFTYSTWFIAVHGLKY